MFGLFLMIRTRTAAVHPGKREAGDYQGETVRTIRPFLKILIRPPDCETTMPIVPVTSVIPATEAWRDPSPAGIWTALVSTVM